MAGNRIESFYCRNMPIPPMLQAKIDLFRSRGRIFREWDELFTEESWLQVMLGHGAAGAA